MTELEEAAELGARRALEKIGLGDKSAAEDIRIVRDFASAIRDAIKTARRTVVRMIVRGLLLCALAGAVWLIWGHPK